MRGRMGRPGLVGTMARTAVIAGTATAVSGSVQRNQQAKAQQQQEAAAYEQQQQQDAWAAQQQATQAPAAPAQDDVMAQIEKLAQLKNAGVLSDAEFTAAKAKLLGI